MSRTISNLLGLVGAVVGGTLGVLAYQLLLRQGLYAIVLPGALLGLGCHILSRHRSTSRGLACAIAALVLGVVTEWASWPMRADPSLTYFLRHLGNLDRPTATPLLWALGAAFGFWWGREPNSRLVVSHPRT